MIVPLILTVLQPLCPALFLRETVRWLIGSLGAWLIDEDYAGWLRKSGDKQELRSLVSFVLFIEEGLSLLIYVRARQKLGHKGRPGRKVRRGPDPSTGHPPSFEDIRRRFERACLMFTEVERLADRRAPKLKRLLDQAACQLEMIHHPVANPAGVGIVGGGGGGGDSRAGAPATPHPAQPIRGPPWADLTFCKSSLIPTRSHHLRDREIMPEAIPRTAARSENPTAYCLAPNFVLEMF